MSANAKVDSSRRTRFFNGHSLAQNKGVFEILFSGGPSNCGYLIF